jgi:MFS family permease
MGFLPIFAIVSMFPAVPSLIRHFEGDPAGVWKVPLMVSAPGLTTALLAPFAGYLADKFGRRSALLMATLAYGVLGTIPVLLTSLNLIFASRLALGCAEAFILTGVNTLIGDYWQDQERRAWLSLQGVIGPFLSIGVILASGSVTALRWNGAFLIYLVGFPIFFAARRYLFEPTKDGATVAELSRTDHAASAFPWKIVLLTGVVTFAMSLLYYVFIINGGIVFKEAGIASSAQLSQLTAVPTLFVMLGAVIFWLLRRTSNALQIAAAFGLLGVGLALIGVLANYRLMLVALTIQQTGAGMAVPALIAWAQTKLPFEHRGRGMGAWTTCFFMGQFVSPAVVHLLDGATGTMHGAFLCAGVFGMAAATAALLLAWRDAGPGKAVRKQFFFEKKNQKTFTNLG